MVKGDRRQFLKQAGMVSVAAGAALSGCGRSQTATSEPIDSAPTVMPSATLPSAPTPTTGATPAAAREISLSGGDAEVWAWQKRVTGRVVSCPAVKVQINQQQQIKADIDTNTFSANLPLQEGENTVQAVCEENNMADSSNAVTYSVRLRDIPFSAIDIQVENGQILLDGSASRPAAQAPSPLTDYFWSARETNPAGLVVEDPEMAGKALDGTTSSMKIILNVPETDGEYYISLRVVDQDGREDTSTTYFTVAGGEARLDDWSVENTAWVEQAVVYGVIPRKFGSKAIQGISERLEDLQDLGVNALWLAPVNDSPPGDYGYAVTDYFEIRPNLGTKEDFRQLVQQAHQRGIRVLMDFVPNHSSDKHPYFQDTLENGMNSHYWEYYDRDDTGAPTHYFNWTNLPNLNYNNPEVERWMTEAFSYWVREFDVDGFRVDVAWGIRERKPEYWPEWRKALKRIKPDLLLLAEASARDEYYFTNGYDAAYDWTGQLGRWAWELVFEKAPLLTYNLNAALTNVGNGFHPDALIFHFINNNDTGERFITRYGLDMTRVATALLLTLPGIPCIYTGDEIGAEFTPYGDPNPLNWEEDPHELRAYHKKWIDLRKEIPALHSRNWTIVEVEPHVQVYGYLRYPTGKPEEAVLVLLNFSEENQEAVVNLPEGFERLGQAGTLHDLASNAEIQTGGQLPIHVPLLAMSAAVLASGENQA